MLRRHHGCRISSRSRAFMTMRGAFVLRWLIACWAGWFVPEWISRLMAPYFYNDINLAFVVVGVSLGICQGWVLRKHAPWWLWGLVTAVGWGVGVFASVAIGQGLLKLAPWILGANGAILVSAIAGTMLGFAQWWWVGRRIGMRVHWVLASGAGISIGWLLFYASGMSMGWWLSYAGGAFNPPGVYYGFLTAGCALVWWPDLFQPARGRLEPTE